MLDDHGAETETVVIHYHDCVFDEEKEEMLGIRWMTWRVSFVDADEMIAQLMTTPEIVERVCLNPDPFVGEDGVFDLRGAERRMGYRS